MRRYNVLCRFGLAFTALFVIGAASSAFAASASAGRVSHRLLSHRGFAVSQPGLTSRVGGLDRSRGSAYSGALGQFDAGAHQSSGWYQRGFGGTLDPGWGYNFGPSLGGSVR